MKILWVKSGALFPLDSGGKKRTHAMLSEISREHQVVYMALRDVAKDLHHQEESDGYASEKVWIPWQETPKGSLRFFFDLVRNLVSSSLPYALQKYRSQPLADWLDAHLDKDNFDLVICDFLIPATNFQQLRSRVPSVLFQHNMEAMIWKRLAESSSNPLKGWYLNGQYSRFSRWERRLSKIFNGVVTVSPEDTHYARSHYGLENVLGDVATGVDVDFLAPRKVITDQSAGIIGFLGSMDWLANIQAVHYFVEEIYPQLKKTCPEVCFRVIGRNPPAAIRQLALDDKSIEVTGSVDDVRPWLKECDLMVVPLLSGGGTRIKILEAMAMGVPVVSTTIGAEGLGLLADEHVVIADDADEFADVTSKLLESTADQKRLADKAFEKLAIENTWGGVSAEFLRLCAGAVASSRLDTERSLDD